MARSVWFRWSDASGDGLHDPKSYNRGDSAPDGNLAYLARLPRVGRKAA